MVVINMIKEHSKPMKLGEILNELGPDIYERTVVRWLYQFIKDGQIIKNGQRRAAVY